MSHPGGLIWGNPVVRFESLRNGEIGFPTGAGFNSGFAGGHEGGVTRDDLAALGGEGERPPVQFIAVEVLAIGPSELKMYRVRSGSAHFIRTRPTRSPMYSSSGTVASGWN